MFSALGMPPFRSVKLRARKASCAGCGNEGERVGKIEETDYVAFCGGGRPDWLSRGLVEGDPQSRIRAKVRVVVRARFAHVVLTDIVCAGVQACPGCVRATGPYCGRAPTNRVWSLPLTGIDQYVIPAYLLHDFSNHGRADIPINELVASPAASTEELDDTKGEADVYVICRLGNDSQMAVDALRNTGRAGVVKDLVGGLRAWSLDVDSDFPIY